MNTTFRFFSAAVLFAVLSFAPAPAPAGLFGGGEKARLLEKADAEYEAAKAAAKGYQVVTQMTELRKAQASYRQLARQYPDYERAKVEARLRETTYTLAALEEKAGRGEISLPAGDLAPALRAPGGLPADAAEIKKPTEPDAPAYRRPIPALVRTGPDRPAGAEPAPAPAAPAAAADPAWLRESLPNPFYDPAPASAPAARPFQALPAPPPGGEAPAREDPVRLGRYAEMIRSGRATDAAMELEDILAREGAAASAGTRILFARALLACGNYARAADELKAVPASADGDPAVLSLRAVAAVAQDDLPRAQLLLDRLVTDFPDYSDAYVDFAYVTFLSDPQNRETRDKAVIYYKVALQRGARRDERLEKELGLRVE